MEAGSIWHEGACITMRLVVKGKLFTARGLIDGSILVEEGRIKKVVKGDPRWPVDEILDYGGRRGNVILPGLVDAHVHMRDLDLSYKEDFYTGTRSAAAGGFTIVADMPNTRPRTNTPRALKEKENLARNKALVDYCLYYGVPNESEHLTEDVQKLAVGIKVYMQDEFYSERRSLVENTLGYAAEKKLLVVSHAEDPAFFVHGPAGTLRTAEAEVSAIKDISGRAKDLNFRLHITHLSSKAGLEELLKQKGGVNLTVDTCPHYLLLSAEDVRMQRGIAKAHPSIKGRVDAKALLIAARNGGIDAITSDHAPHTVEEKSGDMEGALGGFPGLETTLPLLLTLVNKGILGLGDVVRLCSTNPSKILGIRNAGEIGEGKMGNLTIVDLHRKFKIEPQKFESKAKFSPFAGREVEGKAVATVVRGIPVMVDGEIVGPRGWGMNAKTYG